MRAANRNTVLQSYTNRKDPINVPNKLGFQKKIKK
jgi:hypothetical protein